MSGEAEDTDRGEDCLELLGDGAVDEEVGGEVDHDQEVRHALQTHDPPGRDVLVQQLHASHLHICNILSVIAIVINLTFKAGNKHSQSFTINNHTSRQRHYANQPARPL